MNALEIWLGQPNQRITPDTALPSVLDLILQRQKENDRYEQMEDRKMQLAKRQGRQPRRSCSKTR